MIAARGWYLNNSDVNIAMIQFMELKIRNVFMSGTSSQHMLIQKYILLDFKAILLPTVLFVFPPTPSFGISVTSSETNSADSGEFTKSN